jgi:hypothetical protein
VDLAAESAGATDELFSQLREAMGSGGGGGSFGGSSWSLRRAGTVVGAVVAVAAAALGLSWLRPVSTSGARGRSVAVPVSPSLPPSSSTTVAAARVWPDEAVVVDGTEVRNGDERWSIGEPGDLVAVGDWDCRGSSTPGVLRPSLGRVFVFSSWADGAEAVAGPSAPADAVSFAAKGCGRAEVRTASGAVVELEVEGR